MDVLSNTIYASEAFLPLSLSDKDVSSNYVPPVGSPEATMAQSVSVLADRRMQRDRRFGWYLRGIEKSSAKRGLARLSENARTSARSRTFEESAPFEGEFKLGPAARPGRA